MNKIVNKIITLLLTVTIFLSSMNIEVFAYSNRGNTKLNKLTTPTLIMNEEDIPEDIELKEPETFNDVEDIDGDVVLVEEDSVTYQTGEKDFTTVVGGAPSVYEDDSGNLQEIDNTLVESNDTFENASNSYSLQLPKEISEGKGIVVEKDGYSIELIPTEGNFSNSVVKDNAVLYNEVFPGIDYQYTALGNSIKEDIILNRQVDKNEFSFEIKTSLNIEERDGLIYLSNGENDVFSLSAPLMKDASGEICFGVELSLDSKEGKHIAKIIANREWLEAPERVYPIKIDPSTISLNGNQVRLYSVQEDVPYGTGGADYIYAGYDDGIRTGNLALFGTMHGRTRAYAEINYDFSKIPSDAKINKATLTLYQHGNFSQGKTEFGIYTVDNAWSGSSIGWNAQNGFSHTIISTSKSDTNTFSTTWDVKDAINAFVQGIHPNYGLVVKAINENGDQCEVFCGSDGSFPPKLVIEWEIPDPVDVNYSLDKTTINVRPITEKDVKGKLRFDGVFADGVAKPQSEVVYQLVETDYAGIAEASSSYKYPDSTEFNKTFPNGTKYKDKDSNYQTEMFGSGDLEYDKIYYFTATASKDDIVGKETKSDTFLIYKAKGNETLPNIAKYYGAPLQTIMKDNQVQDVLVIQNNTLFIRNPKKTKPYVSKLSLDDKKLIDSALMGRGLHCEYGFEPINLNTGNFYFNTSDLEIEDLGGVFGIERTYNSKADYNNSLFGHNWSFKYDEHLSRLENGNILYTTGDGKLLQFVYKNGKYVSPNGYYLNLKEVKVVKDKIEYTKYEITENNGSKRIFNTYGLLEEVVDELGHSTKLEYDESFNLSKIISPSDKLISFKSNEFGQIVEAILPNGSKLEYKYDDNDDLVEYIDANGNSIKY